MLLLFLGLLGCRLYTLIILVNGTLLDCRIVVPIYHLQTEYILSPTLGVLIFLFFSLMGQEEKPVFLRG